MKGKEFVFTARGQAHGVSAPAELARQLRAYALAGSDDDGFCFVCAHGLIIQDAPGGGYFLTGWAG